MPPEPVVPVRTPRIVFDGEAAHAGQDTGRGRLLNVEAESSEDPTGNAPEFHLADETRIVFRCLRQGEKVPCACDLLAALCQRRPAVGDAELVITNIDKKVEACLGKVERIIAASQGGPKGPVQVFLCGNTNGCE